jgi:glutathione S-transferase
VLEDTLVETGGPYIQGSNSTQADINLMPYVARLDYLGLLDLWIKDRPHVKTWWATARRWPSFKSGLLDRISETERSEMRVHGTKILNDVGDAISEVRRNMIATT